MRSTASSGFDTDKIEPHGYFQTYVQLAGELGPSARILELGVENGESLRMWKALFPLGDITGVDIHPGARWARGTRMVLAAQDDPGLPEKLGGKFALIVDDASHDGEKTRASFDLLWPMVLPGGYYVVEDWSVALGDGIWGTREKWGDSMLRTAESFLPMLFPRDAECDFILYRYGLIIIHKRSSA